MLQRRGPRADDRGTATVAVLGRPLTKLSILMAAYNEERTILEAVRDVLDADIPCSYELIVVDDGSTDATWDLLLSEVTDPRLVRHRHLANLGKGAAIRSGVRLATGTHVLPFDADLEYAASDITKLVRVALETRAPAVFGVRPEGHHSSVYVMGNHALTQAANLLFDAHLSDLHSCLKLVDTELIRAVPFTSIGFGTDTEITAALLKHGIHPREVEINYRGRSRREGKKITWWDGVTCLWILSRVRFSRPDRGLPDSRVLLDTLDAAAPGPAMPAWPTTGTHGSPVRAVPRDSPSGST